MERINQSPSNGAAERPTLALAARLWQTPTVADTMGGHLSRSGDRSSELLLRGQAKEVTAALWGTPKARDRKGEGFSQDLPSQMLRWATPTAMDRKASGGSGVQPRTTLTDMTVRASRLDPVTCPHGATCRPVLNPRFVEWLMGFPTGWSDCTHSAMASFPSWLRRHSAPSTPDSEGSAILPPKE
jgi:DNA (cytosine-5)-methyltransferase 1